MSLAIPRTQHPQGLLIDSLGLLFVAVVSALAIVFVPLVALAGFSLACLSLAFWFWPKPVLLGLGVFLVFQDLLTSISTKFAGAALPLFKHGDEAAIALMLILTMLRRQNARNPSLVFPLLALASIGVLSAAISHAAGPAPVLLDGFLMFKGFLLFEIARRTDFTPEDVRVVARFLLGLGLFLLATVTINYVSPGLLSSAGLPRLEYRLSIPAAQGILIHPGTFSEVMTFLSLLALGSFVVVRRRSIFVAGLAFALGALLSLRLRPIVTIPATLTLASLFVGTARSRTARVKKGLWLGIACALLVITLASGLFWNLLSGKLGAEGPRLALARTSAKIARDYFPLGTGLGTFGGYASARFYSPIYYKYGLDTTYGLSPTATNDVSDSNWSHVLGETGVLGLCCYLAVLGSIFRQVHRIFRRSEEPWLLRADPWLYGAALGVLLILIESLFEAFVAPIYEAPLSVYLIFFAAGAVVAAGAHPDAANNEKASSRDVDWDIGK